MEARCSRAQSRGDVGRRRSRTGLNRPIQESLGCKIVALVDDTPDLVSPVAGVPLLRGQQELEHWLQRQVASTWASLWLSATRSVTLDAVCMKFSRVLASALFPFATQRRCCVRRPASDPGCRSCLELSFITRRILGASASLTRAALSKHDCVLQEGVGDWAGRGLVRTGSRRRQHLDRCGSRGPAPVFVSEEM